MTLGQCFLTAWMSWRWPPLAVGFGALLAWSKVEGDNHVARMFLDPLADRPRSEVLPIRAFQSASFFIAYFGGGVTAFRWLLGTFMQEPDRVKGAFIVPMTNVSALHIILAAMMALSVYNILVRPVREASYAARSTAGPIRRRVLSTAAGLMNRLLPIPAGVAFARLLPSSAHVGPLIAAAAAMTAVYLFSWFGAGRAVFRFPNKA